MRNDSIESLLQRHYGNAAPAPTGLEQRLHASIQHAQPEASALQEQRVSRRQALRFVALSTAGLSVLNIGLESLQAFEDALVGQAQDAAQPAYP